MIKRFIKRHNKKYKKVINRIDSNNSYTDKDKFIDKLSLYSYIIYAPLSILLPIYLFSLPLLSKFVNNCKNSLSINCNILNISSNRKKCKPCTSVSCFIANAPATGMMSALIFLPLTHSINFLYEELTVNRKNIVSWKKYILLSTQYLFLLFFASFLCGTVTVYPVFHQWVVILFVVFYLLYSLSILLFIPNSFSIVSVITLGISILSCIVLLFLLKAKTILFWFFESLAFSSMLLFTIIEHYSRTLYPNTILE